ncbi:hypothetical protein [Agathobaculum sp.]|uniref:hypothetical protein n=1 Tax=Agathobaculum sp. TaxID=2048138 RepID=UPI00351F8A74
MTCAGDLARMGYEVTVFEALHTAGGVSDVRHPGVPSPEGDRPEGDRHAEGAGRRDHDSTSLSAAPRPSTSCLRRL